MKLHRNFFVCSKCQTSITHLDSFTTGYGLTKDNEKVCFKCCGKEDNQSMLKTGKAVLYLCEHGNKKTLTNWPNTLCFNVAFSKVGRHNIARSRCDVWFKAHGYIWHGVQYGNNSQLCYCKQTKQREW